MSAGWMAYTGQRDIYSGTLSIDALIRISNFYKSRNRRRTGRARAKNKAAKR